MDRKPYDFNAQADYWVTSRSISRFLPHKHTADPVKHCKHAPHFLSIFEMPFGQDNPQKMRTRLLLIILLAAGLRFWFASDNPYTGDEVTSVLNASVYRATYYDHITYGIRPVIDYQYMLTYTGEYGMEELLQRFTENSRGHPPLYYVLLHLLIKFIGNDILLIRMLSVCCSLLSIWFVYQIGIYLSGYRTGLLAAMLMAVAPFSVFYSSMVRPYPLAMALSLATTAMTLRFIREDTFNLRNPRVYVFSILSALGLYTIYHYGLSIVFQFSLLLFSAKLERKRFIRLCVAGGILLIIVLPWMNLLFSTVDTVRTDSAPHKGANESFWVVAKTLIHLNFVELFTIPALTNEAPPLLIRATRFGLFLMSYGLIVWGFFKVWPHRKRWPLAAAIGGYYATNWALDLGADIHSLSMEKLQYLPVPISLVFIAAATSTPLQLGRRTIRLWPGVLALFITGSLYLCIVKPRYEDPFTIRAIQHQLHTKAGDRPYLFMSNSHSERQFFTSVSVAPSHGDYFIFRRKFWPDNQQQLINLDKYDFIFFCNFVARGFESYLYTKEELEQLTDILHSKGYNRIEPAKLDEWNIREHLLIFEKVPTAP